MAKTTVKAKITREAYETALQAYVRNSNEISSLSAKRDKEVQALNEKYDPKFADYSKLMYADFETVKAYCKENRDKLFTDSEKSTEVFGAHIGFRDGSEKVIILEGFDEKVIAQKWVKLKAWVKFLRFTAALDKKAIVKAKPKGLEKHGLKVGKEETFFLDPVKTEAA